MAVRIDSRAGKQAPVAFLDDVRKRRERDGLAANVAEPPDDQPLEAGGGTAQGGQPGPTCNLLAARRVRILLDCDEPGRRAAEALAGSLEPVGWAVAVLDLSPETHVVGR